jgi:hypothetical protein
MMQAQTADWQSAFAQALLDPDCALPASVVSHLSTRPHRRFAVYRNNVVVALTGALEARFPAVRRIVGEDFFHAMAQVFVTENPPRTPIMMIYGEAFPAFIDGFEPAASVPYLADVARLEAARTRAYHAADAEPLPGEVLAETLRDDAPTLRFVLDPSLEIVTSPFPIVTIWAMNVGDLELAPLGDWSSEDALVLRPRLDVEVRRLPPGGARFLEALLRGSALGVAAETAHAAAPSFDLAENLALLLGAGFVVGVRRAI